MITPDPRTLSAQLHAFFQHLSHDQPYSALLGGSVEASALNRWWILGLHPRQHLTLQGQTLTWNGTRQSVSLKASEALWATLESARHQCQSWPEEKARYDLPMAGGLLGAMAYNFYRWCDPGWQDVPAPSNSPHEPDLVLFEFEDWLLFDMMTQRWVILSPDPRRTQIYRALWARIQSDETICPPSMPNTNHAEAVWDRHQLDHAFQRWHASFNAPRFEQAVDTLKQAIAQGEIYQANLSIQLQQTLQFEPLALFSKLCQLHPAPFSGWLHWPDGAILSNSPERLVSMSANDWMQTRPIAGTRGRGSTPEEDQRIGDSLLHNEKERAEHLMLVDLGRNDLGRVCRAGSVTVSEPLVLERYSHVTHLVSNITGQREPGKSVWQVVQSVFPGGTITGCPKVRCVKLLNQIEPVSRGFYTGSMGYLDAASDAMDWNILIRSLFLQGTEQPFVYNTAVHIGAGIVHDAIGAHEYRECQRKAQAILQTLSQHAQPVP